MGLKEFSRLVRVRSAITQLVIDSDKMLNAALDLGYFDQAHFIHELGDLVNKKPGALRDYLQQIEHKDLRW